MSRRNVNAKGRRIKGRFGMVPEAVHESRAYRSLSPRAAKLLLDMLMQYDGKNNGDLNAAFHDLKPYGWGSKNNLHRAAMELLESRLIYRTRVGGRNNTCSLYALAWQPIDECRHEGTGSLKFDPGVKIGEAPGGWQDRGKN